MHVYISCLHRGISTCDAFIHLVSCFQYRITRIFSSESPENLTIICVFWQRPWCHTSTYSKQSTKLIAQSTLYDVWLMLAKHSSNTVQTAWSTLYCPLTRTCMYRMDKDGNVAISWEEWRGYLILQPNTTVSSIFKIWSHATVSDTHSNLLHAYHHSNL